MDNSTKIKLLEGNIRAFKARMSSSTDKDGLRRQVKACEARIRQLKDEEK